MRPLTKKKKKKNTEKYKEMEYFPSSEESWEKTNSDEWSDWFQTEIKRLKEDKEKCFNKTEKHLTN